MTEEPPPPPLRLPDDLRDQLPRHIAHALRTPLGLVNAALQELDSPEGEDPLVVLGRRGTRQLARLADRLSLLGRLVRGEYSPRVPTDVVPLVDQAIEEVTLTRPRRRVETTKGAMPSRARVEGDAGILRAAISELIDNAIRFAKSSVGVSVRVDDGQVVVEVRDDGPGPTAATAVEGLGHGGLGVGLLLARTIVEAHQGQLTLADGDQGGGIASIALCAVD